MNRNLPRSGAYTYFQVIKELVDLLVSAAGTAGALRALRLLPPGSPPEGLSEFDNSLKLAHFVQQAGQLVSPSESRALVISVADRGSAFLDEHHSEVLRQARTAHNAALALACAGPLVLLVGIVLLYLGNTPTGAISTAAGAIAGLSSTRVFRITRTANDRADRLANQLQGLRALPAEVSRIDRIEDSSAREQALKDLARTIPQWSETPISETSPAVPSG